MIENQSANTLGDRMSADKKQNEFNELVSQISADLESGKKVDWDQLKTRYPQYAQDLIEIRPAMDALRNLKLAQTETSRSEPMATIANQILGDFQIHREIGRGGMGVVYEAHQISIPRRVALKILPLAELIDDKALLRFKNEVAAIATLEHPHIVSVYSIGEERGVHYFAMQLVHGQSLAAVIRELRDRTRTHDSVTGEDIDSLISDRIFTDHRGQISVPDNTSENSGTESNAETIARGKSTTAWITDPNYFRRMVRLILPVADALQHAHDQGIVHRDVKPGNLLLDKSGRLFITDFGLARIDTGAGVTMTGDILGTLRYMSPEQMSGSTGLIDHRTDIYSLGATLYEALTLQPVFRGENRAALVNQVGSDEPTPLRKVNPSVPEDLETIVLKAINKNPMDRYETASDLAADLNRFLESKPIEARPPKLIEKLSKWAYRHRSLVAVAMAALMLIALVASGSALLIWNSSQKRMAALQQRGRALEERARAVEERGRAVEQARLSTQRQSILDDFILRNIVQSAYPGDEGGDRDITVRNALLKARRNIESAFGDDLLLRSHTHYTIGKYCVAMGEHEIAREELQLAIDGYRELIRSDGKQTVQAYLGEAMQGLVDAFWGLEQFDEALSAAREALAISRDNDLEINRDTVSQLWRIGATYNKQRKLGKSEPVLQEAFELAKDQGFTNLKALIRLEQGNMNFYQQKYDAAETLWQEALATFESSAGDNEYNIMTTRYNLSNLFWETGEKENSINYCRQVYDEMTASRGPLYPFALEILGMLANRQRINGDLEAAEQNYQLLLERSEQRFGPESNQVADALAGLGLTLQERDDVEQAVEALERSLDIERKLHGEDHMRAIQTGSMLALALNDLGRIDQAAELIQRAIDFQQRELAEHPDDWATAQSLAGNFCNLGILLHDKKEDHPEAIESFNEAVRLLTVVHHDHPTDLSATFLTNSLQWRALSWIKMGEKEKFSEDLDRVIAMTGDPSIQQELRLEKACYLAEAGETAEALDIVDDELPVDGGYQSYLVGQVYAWCAGHAQDSLSTNDKDKPLPFDQYAAQSLDHLRRAREKGYFQFPKQIEALQETSDAFDSIRHLAEFQQLISEINESRLKDNTTTGAD
jgi:serine/threonine protein kinase